ncbi:hypothetical protein SAZ11_30170 [Streptomyces sp. FXJ1.4098]|nr:hypothetical protein [Streptomyces sp. FXJ1.4098]
MGRLVPAVGQELVQQRGQRGRLAAESGTGAWCVCGVSWKS